MNLFDKMKNYSALTEDFMKKHTDSFYENEDFAIAKDAVKPLFDSFSYSLFAGGKRLRPFLVYEFCSLCGGNPEDAVSYASAIEMVHTSSLIHDDLPCMDNDDMRRGKTTNHKVFGEDVALLAGDALFLYASVIATDNGFDAERNLKAVKLLSQSSGVTGMIAGQQIDMWTESNMPDKKILTLLQEKKTGALFECACLLGCIAAGKYEGTPEYSAAKSFAKHAGLAFQITDDVLDVCGNPEELGKNVGSDEANGKTTFATLLGIEGAKALASEETGLAKAALFAFSNTGRGVSSLNELADYIITRKN